MLAPTLEGEYQSVILNWLLVTTTLLLTEVQLWAPPVPRALSRFPELSVLPVPFRYGFSGPHYQRFPSMSSPWFTVNRTSDSWSLFCPARSCQCPLRPSDLSPILGYPESAVVSAQCSRKILVTFIITGLGGLTGSLGLVLGIRG